MASSAPVILLVTDHQDSLAMYALGLLAFGFFPMMAGDAEQAFVRAAVCHPDVIVAAAWLRGISIADLTRRFRGDPRTTGARIIVLDSDGDSANASAKAGVKAGVKASASDASPADASDAPEPSTGEDEADMHLLKSCPPDVLGLAIRSLLTQPTTVGTMARYACRADV